jgi:hypothetical protein
MKTPNPPSLPFWQQVTRRNLVIAESHKLADPRIKNEHRLRQLSIEFYPLASRLLDTLATNGHIVCVASTFRDAKTQETLFRLGRTAPGTIVTNAPPTGSAHCRTVGGEPQSDAMDIYPVLNARPSFATDATTARFYNDLEQLCDVWDLRWGGHFKSVPGDYGHVEYRRPLTDPTHVLRKQTLE